MSLNKAVKRGRKVYKLEIYSVVRKAYFVQGKSQRKIAKELNINRRTIQKILKQSVPPGYQRQKGVN